MTRLSAEDLKQRAKRFARLRAVERTLTPSFSEEFRACNSAEAREIRIALIRIKDARDTGDEAILAEGLGSVDTALANLGGSLLTAFDAIPFPQLRATMPAVAESHREECLALVDLILSDWGNLIDRIPTLEYLITLLSCVYDGRFKRVVTDPVTLTPDLQAACTRIHALADAGIDEVEVEVELHRAAGSILDAPDPRIILRQIRRRKAAIGLGIFAPGALRSIVTYNVKFSNLMHERLEDARQEDLDLVEDFPPRPEIESEDSDAIEFDPKQDEPAETNPAVAFAEAPGVLLVQDALRRVLRRVSFGSCDSEVVALSFDLSLLQEGEIEALLCAEPDEYLSLVSRVALLGYLIQSVPTCEKRLRALEIMPETLREVWLVAIDEELKALVQSKIAAGDYETSMALADLKGRFLYDPLSARIRERGRRQGRTSEDAAHDGASEMHEAGRAAALDLGSGGTTRMRDAANRNREHEAGDAGPPSQWHRRILPWAAAAAIVISGANFLVARANFEIHDLSNRQLLAVSNYLASAYRDGEGKGRLVVGRIDESFLELSSEQQIEAANEIASNLTAEGVVEVMLYDKQRKLVIHWAGGKLRRPFPAEQSAWTDAGST